MITIELTANEQQRIIDLLKDNISYVSGDSLIRLAEALSIVAKPDREVRLTCIQWREIWEFVDDEDADEINLSLTTKIEDAQSDYATAERGVAA